MDAQLQIKFFMINKQDNFFIVSGGPGSGKTSLLQMLAHGGYHIIAEDARRIIQQQVEVNGSGLPWKDKALYLQLMLEASLHTYQSVQQKGTSDLYFFDRSIIDALCYCELIDLDITPEMEQAAKNIRYNPKVFLLPPWQEIYHTDTERKQTWAEAVATYAKIKDVYMRFGYQIIELPKDTLEKRRDFVLQVIRNRIL